MTKKKVWPKFQAVRVCREHGGLYDPAPEASTGRQQQCHGAADVPTWVGYDFNEWIHLCECCQQEAMPSGSRFSPFFCLSCLILLGDRSQGIPIGRHSLMNGVVLASDDFAGFAAELGAMFRAIDELHAWSRQRVLELIGPVESDPLMVDVMAAARRRGTRVWAWLDLIKAWRER